MSALAHGGHIADRLDADVVAALESIARDDATQAAELEAVVAETNAETAALLAWLPAPVLDAETAREDARLEAELLRGL